MLACSIDVFGFDFVLCVWTLGMFVFSCALLKFGCLFLFDVRVLRTFGIHWFSVCLLFWCSDFQNYRMYDFGNLEFQMFESLHFFGFLMFRLSMFWFVGLPSVWIFVFDDMFVHFDLWFWVGPQLSLIVLGLSFIVLNVLLLVLTSDA